jgi:hypothetical protein
MCMRCVPEDGVTLPPGHCEGKRAQGVCIEQNERTRAGAGAGFVTLALRMPKTQAPPPSFQAEGTTVPAPAQRADRPQSTALEHP